MREATPEELQARVELVKAIAHKQHESQTYQTVRGDRFIPRYSTHDERDVPSMGRRTEHEGTAFVQVARRYLKNHGKLNDIDLVECMAGILCIAEGELRPTLPSIQRMKSRIRARVKGAMPLAAADYQVALSVAFGVDSEMNVRRQQIFNLAMAVLNAPVASVKDLAREEVELGRFSAGR